MKLILKYMKPYSRTIALCLSFKILGTFVELAIPYILKYILDTVAPTNSLKMIFLWGAIMVLCAVGAWVGNIIANRLASKVARDGSRHVRHDLFEKTMLLSCRDVDRFSIPSLESRLTTDTYNVNQFMGMMLRIGVRAPILLCGGLFFTFFLDKILTLILVGVMPIIFLVVYLVTSRGVKAYLATQRSVDGMVRVAREDCQGIRVIKALSKSDYEKERYETVNANLVRNETKASLIMATSNPIISFFVNLGMVLVIFIGAMRTQSGLCTAGTIIAFSQFFTMISNAMIAVTRIFVNATKATASMNRIGEVLRTDPDCPVASKEEYPDYVPADGKVPHIRFSDVTFSYNNNIPQIEHLTLDVYKGQTLGIIGSTGSGKTTLISLLMRFYEPNEGNIYLDGQNLKTMDAHAIHARFGAAMQNDFLYADTIRENIRFGRDISDEQIQKASEIAQADEFFRAYPEGYDHMLAIKGQNVSGGQKQRILVARAIAGKPEILVLDDSSSALDYKTEADLRSALHHMPDRPTTVIVAQRVSAIKDADQILVLEDGRVIGRGTHDELMESCSVYREIADSQMGDGNGEGGEAQ